MNFIKKNLANILIAILLPLASLGVAVNLCHFYDRATLTANPHSSNEAKIVDAQACTKELECIDVYAAIGEIDFDMSLLVSEISDNSKPICFVSGGGKGTEALLIANAIRKAELSTCITERLFIENTEITAGFTSGETEYEGVLCLSACGFIYLSAEKRIAVGDDLFLGIHAPRKTIDLCWCTIDDPFGSEIKETPATIRSIFALPHTKQTQPDFVSIYNKSLETPADEMHILTLEEMKKFNTVTLWI